MRFVVRSITSQQPVSPYLRFFLIATLMVARLATGTASAQHEEILTLAGGNWIGDSNTQGGLDAGLAGDNDCLVASGDSAIGFPAAASLTINLTHDYSRNLLIAFTIGYRTNSQQATVGTILWDGRPIATCHPSNPAEKLTKKKVIVSSSDFDFAPGTHTLTIQANNEIGNTFDLFEVDAVVVAPVGPYHGIEQRPPENWLIVTGAEATTAETDNVDKLLGEMTAACAGTVAKVTAAELTEAQKADNNLIVVGRYGTHDLARQILSAHGITDPFAADAPFVKEQGYVAAVYPGAVNPNRKAIVAAGWNPLGSMYAASHLRTHLRYANGQPYLDAEGSPRAFKEIVQVRRPDLEERAIYYNIAYGISYGSLTPDNWTDTDWQKWVDKIVCAQLTHIYFFLWGSLELNFPKSTINSFKNNIVHQNLIKMIDYAHRRGLKVAYQFSPTLVPSDIFQAIKTAVPNAAGVNTYNDSIVCPAETSTLTYKTYSWNGTMELMKDAYGNELELFKKADAFNLWFYDPGGCFCGATRHNCLGLQSQRLMEQVDVFYKLVQQKNPQAKFTVVTWPIWALESRDYYNISYRNEFLGALKTYFADAMDKVTILDSNIQYDTLLVPARSLGFRLNGFVYWTNIETGYPFLIPMLDYLTGEAQRSKTWQVNALHLMRIEEGSKFPNTYMAAELFWDRNLTKEAMVRQYAQWVANTNAEAAEKIYQALMMLDTFMNNGTGGQDHEAKGAQIKSLVESALALLPAAKQIELEFLLTTARAMALLGQAIEHPDQQIALKQQYSSLLSASPSFKACAPYSSTTFPNYVKWIQTGWKQAIF